MKPRNPLPCKTASSSEIAKSFPLKSRYNASYLENASTIHQKVPVVAKSLIPEWLCQEVCMLFLRLRMSNDKLSPKNKLPKKMVSHVDVIRGQRTLCARCLTPLLSSKTDMHVAPKPGKIKLHAYRIASPP